MVSVLLHSTSLSPTFRLKTHKLPLPRINVFRVPHKPAVVKKPESLLSFPTFLHLGCPRFTATRASRDDFLGKIEKDESLSLTLSEEKPVKFLFWVLVWASVSLGLHALCGDARAAVEYSIRGSGFGVKVANALRASGWPDEAIVFSLATLPVIELRGSIPVGYWLQLHPFFLTLLSVLGLVSCI